MGRNVQIGDLANVIMETLVSIIKVMGVPYSYDHFEEGEVTFGTPVAMPGAVSLSLEPNGEPSNFYADGYAYYTISNNMGYEGDLELAMVPEGFRTDVLKESLDSNQVLVKNANVETANFALLFEFDGDPPCAV